MRALLKEPLLHFILVATILFAAYALVQGQRQAAERTIFVPAAELERLGAIYTAEAGTLPGPEEVRGLLADYVRREALAREARRLGLDEGDLVVDRRLEQKMAFVAADLVQLSEPDDTILRDWYDTNIERFQTPVRVTFDHVYFRDGDNPAIASAATALSAAEVDGWRQIGDPFMLQLQYGDLPIREVRRLFGVDFVNSVLELVPSEAWQGPVRSALGTHFVRLTSRRDIETPAFETVRAQVLSDWQDATRRQLNEDAIAEIISNYDVIIEGIDG
ncbi:MAG: peptidylprolyl isomerase [Pseudomonadota bacterium]